MPHNRVNGPGIPSRILPLLSPYRGDRLISCDDNIIHCKKIHSFAILAMIYMAFEETDLKVSAYVRAEK
jgi:hypothetical protein